MTDASSCLQCLEASIRKVWGGYAMSCVRCCARLLRSDRPLRDAQEGLLFVMARHPDWPQKAEVLQAMKAMD